MNSSQHALSIVPELAYGTTPANPAFLRKNITGTTLALSKDFIESATINPNRQVMDVRHGNRQVGGDISCELAFAGHDDMLEAVLCGTWTADKLVPGVTRRSFSVLRHYTDMAAGGLSHHIFKGVEFNTFALSIAPNKIIEATFGTIGREKVMLAAAPAGATFTDASPNKGFDSFTGSMLVDGQAVSVVTEMSLNVENGFEPRWVVFSDVTNQPKAGKVRVTGSLTLYFEDASFLVAFNGAVKRDLDFTLVDLEGNEYRFELPSVLGGGDSTDAAQENDITITWPFRAIYEPGTDNPNALRITRTAV